MSLLASLLALVPALIAPRRDPEPDPVVVDRAIAGAIEDRDALIGVLTAKIADLTGELSARTEQLGSLAVELGEARAERNHQFEARMERDVTIARMQREMEYVHTRYAALQRQNQEIIEMYGGSAPLPPTVFTTPPGGVKLSPEALAALHNQVAWGQLGQQQANAQLQAQQAFLPYQGPGAAQRALLDAQRFGLGVMMEVCDCTPRGGRAGAMRGMTPLAHDD
jgi:hypothetical protein